MRYYLLCLFMINGCGSGVYGEATYRPVDEFTPYLEEFIAAGVARGVRNSLFASISIEFGRQPEGTGGTCYRPFVGGRYIWMNAVVWRAASSLYRRAYLFHELGHCLLNQEHRGGSIMSSPPDTFYLLLNEVGALDELFYAPR